MKFSSLKKLLTNNNRFTPDDSDYRRVYLLNVILLLHIVVAVFFAVLNIIAGFYHMFAVETAAGVLCIAALVFFHKTDRVNLFSWITVAVMLGMMAAIFLKNMHTNYIFIWCCVYPPVVIFLLGSRKGLAVSLAMWVYLAVFMGLSYKGWSPVEFSFISIINILSVLLSLALLLAYVELSRQETAAAVLQKNIELEDANRSLSESREQLRLILDSTAEAIFGVDMHLRCTFCNTSAVEMLGLKSAEELLGRDMHALVHYKDKNGMPLPRTECSFMRTCMEGVAIHVDDEVFWRPNGTSFEVEYNSYPQYKNGELVGAVVTFIDNTLKRMHEQQIEYFSSHDSLTGLLNRSYFETMLKKTDTKSNLPISIILGDLNGLKLTNDIFGHSAGDELLIKVAENLKRICRNEDLIGRWGGDEFVVLLPKTQHEDAKAIMTRIKDVLLKEKVNAIRCSMSLGCDTKTNPDQSLDLVMKNAESEMYKEKAMTRNKVSADMINALIMFLYGKSHREERHSSNVSELCKEIGEALALSDTEVAQLRRAGFLHDIGKIGIDASVIDKNEETYTETEESEYRQHPVIGYRILNLFDNTLSLADSVYSHHERWDGTGFPRGLKGSEIPLNARIIAVAGRYDTLLNDSPDGAMDPDQVLEELQNEAGTRLDPHVVEVFVKMMKNKQL